MKTKRLFVMALVVVLLVGVLVTPVQASKNGQQINFTCGYTSSGNPRMDYAIIKGYNQNGSYVTWQGNVTKTNIGTTKYTYIKTNGWWWVGNVRIYWWSAKTNSWLSKVYSVPKSQSGNWMYFTC